MTKIQFSIFSAFAIFLWAAYSWLLGNLDLTHLVGFGLPISLSWIAWLIYDRKYWKLEFFNGWLNDTPNLVGAWSGELRSSFKPEGSESAIDPIRCFALIDQSSTDIDMRLFTEKSQSQTISANIYRVGLIGHEMSVHYRNDPLADQRDQSPLHFGTLKVRINTLAPASIEGEYWTSRRTTGDLILSKRADVNFSTFEEAARAFDRGS